MRRGEASHKDKGIIAYLCKEYNNHEKDFRTNRRVDSCDILDTDNTLCERRLQGLRRDVEPSTLIERRHLWNLYKVSELSFLTFCLSS